MFEYPSFGKFQDGGGRHLRNTQTDVSRPFLDQFCTKFGLQTHTAHTTVTLALKPSLEIQDGGRRYVGFCFSAISRSPINIFACNFWQADIYCHTRVAVAVSGLSRLDDRGGMVAMLGRG